MRLQTTSTLLLVLAGSSLACVPSDDAPADNDASATESSGASATETGSDPMPTTSAEDDTLTTEDPPMDDTETGADTQDETSTETGEDTEEDTDEDTAGTETGGTETGDTQADTGTETGAGIEPVEPSCAEALQLPAGLSFHLTQATCAGDSCTWDYDPVGAEITNITGSFTPETGAFEWVVSYDPTHWRVSTTVSGEGTIDELGDESSSYTSTTLDVLEVERSDDVVLTRAGCELTRTTTNEAQQEFVLAGSFGDDFTYTEGQIPSMWTGSGTFPADAEGTRTPAGAVTESFSVAPADPDDFPDFWWGYDHERSADADGNSDVVFSQWNAESEWSRSGMCSWDLTGTQSCEVEVDSEDWGADAVWTVDYMGNGSGVFSAWFYNPQTMMWGPQDCPITFDEGVCSWECPAGQSDDCRYFLME